MFVQIQSRIFVIYSSESFTISLIQVLETVTSLNLSHNRLHSLDGITAFVSLTALNLNYNIVGSQKNLNRIMKLRHLKTLHLQGDSLQYVLIFIV